MVTIRQHASSQLRWRIAAGALVLVALVVVQLYLYSPWHQHQAGRGQYCRFNPVEQSGGLESAEQVLLPVPTLHHITLPDVVVMLPARPGSDQSPSRAPPA